MNIAYFDCFSGIAGDMTLGALLDLGMPTNTFTKEINKLNLTGYTLQVQRVTRNHISALDVIIEVTETQPHRTFSDIQKIITDSTLSKKIQESSINIFTRLAQAEGKIHQISPTKVHFHEVGAVDSLIDIIGTVILLDYHTIKELYCSPLPLGKGFIDCAHGTLPLPAPATLELVKNIPVYQTNRDQELVTPTGAAILTTLATSFGGMPQMKISKIGYGAGKTESTYPNLLRIYLGKLDSTKRN